MSVYKVAAGANVPLLSLVNVAPQCRSEGVKATIRQATPLGVVEQGLYVELVFSALSKAKYQALLPQFGVNVALSAAVTVLVPGHDRVWRRYNGLAIQPEVGTDVRWDYFPRVVMLVRNLELAT